MQHTGRYTTRYVDTDSRIFNLKKKKKDEKDIFLFK